MAMTFMNGETFLAIDSLGNQNRSRVRKIMGHDWTNAWLQQAAGWKAVKEGLAMHANGLVRDARFDGDLCVGQVGGAKTLRVKVRRLNATTAETLCSCLENRRSGAMCAHAVAVIAASRELPAPATVETSVARVMPSPQALAVRFFPYWKQEWAKGKISCRIEKADRGVGESDGILGEWLAGILPKVGPLPWVLSLQGSQAEDFLERLSDHEDCSCEGQTIVFLSSAPAIPVKSHRSEDHWIIEFLEKPWSFLGQRSSRWMQRDGAICPISDPKFSQFLYQLFTEKYSNLIDNELFYFIDSHSPVIAQEKGDLLERIQLRPVRPRWCAKIDGGMKRLFLRLEKEYRWQQRVHRCPASEQPGLLGVVGDEWHFAIQGDEADFTSQLSAMGWKWQMEVKCWVMAEESAIWDFFESGADGWRRLFDESVESETVQNARNQLVILKPSFHIEPKNKRETLVRLDFMNSGGVVFDSQKIQQLMRSGKRLIQASDGKSLLLPKESWDVFCRTAADAHWRQEQGAYSIKDADVILLQFLRNYFSKRHIDNDIIEHNSIDLHDVHADLREYQSRGASWLYDRLTMCGFALLADEMGLGKTLQTIVVIARLASLEKPALVVVPTSLLFNWEAEIARFAPHLQTLVWHGQSRTHLSEQQGQQVVITSYGVLVKDRAQFLDREFSLVVLDEAGAIRNPDTDNARACFRLRSSCKLALTGTPLENSVQDLWSIFHFLKPGYLGERADFLAKYQPDTGDFVAFQSLRLRVMPFMLRRTKSDVAQDLPEKVESDEWCGMSTDQARLYDQVWRQGAENLETLSRTDSAAAQMSLLTLLLRLRQICCDAALFAPELMEKWTLEQRSGKIKRLLELIDGSIASGRKMLIFSQFATQLRNIEAVLEERGISSLRLDGVTRDRQQLVNRFQSSDGPPIFLISLKAGGYGLNLTQASAVVHVDPWWNPAAERQASDRAHRIGQMRSVNIYRLLTKGTVEDRVRALQQQKSELVANLIGGQPTAQNRLSAKEMSDILDFSRLTKPH
jgi:superfamily II DNA or RNA helicase